MVETTANRESSKSNKLSGESAKEQAVTEYQHQQEDFQALVDDVSTSVSEYCRNRPMVAGLALFAFGFYVGWRVKPW